MSYNSKLKPTVRHMIAICVFILRIKSVICTLKVYSIPYTYLVNCFCCRAPSISRMLAVCLAGVCATFLSSRLYFVFVWGVGLGHAVLFSERAFVHTMCMRCVLRDGYAFILNNTYTKCFLFSVYEINEQNEKK